MKGRRRVCTNDRWVCLRGATDETTKNGGMHYPQHAAKIQLGIWDASNPLGTSQWAKGPINWDKAPAKMTAVVKSVTVECA